MTEHSVELSVLYVRDIGGALNIVVAVSLTFVALPLPLPLPYTCQMGLDNNHHIDGLLYGPTAKHENLVSGVLEVGLKGAAFSGVPPSEKTRSETCETRHKSHRTLLVFVNLPWSCQAGTVFVNG